MAEFDLVIRGGHVATAEDEFDGDIGIADGKIAAMRAYWRPEDMHPVPEN